MVTSEPGSRLPTEQELCRQLKIGRSTLREAVRALTFIGAIHSRRGSGTYVSVGDDGTFEKLLGLGLMVQRSRVSEIVEMRRTLELESARLAALRHTIEERRELEALMEAMAASISKLTDAAKLDLRYHVYLARASHNTVLQHLVGSMRVILEAWMTRAIDRQSVTAQIVEEHNAVLQAVFARDPESAVKRMDAHLSHAADRLRAAIGDEQLTSAYVSAILSRSS